MDVGSYSSIVRELVAKAGGPCECLGYISFNWLTNVDVVKDLWCSSTCSWL